MAFARSDTFIPLPVFLCPVIYKHLAVGEPGSEMP